MPPSGGGDLSWRDGAEPHAGAPLACVTVAVNVTAWPTSRRVRRRGQRGDGLEPVGAALSWSLRRRRHRGGRRRGRVVGGRGGGRGCSVVGWFGGRWWFVVVVVEVEVDASNGRRSWSTPRRCCWPPFGSAVAADTVAVFVIDVPAVTVGSTWTTMLKVAVAPAASDAYVTVTSPAAPTAGDVMVPAGPEVCDRDERGSARDWIDEDDRRRLRRAAVARGPACRRCRRPGGVARHGLGDRQIGLRVDRVGVGRRVVGRVRVGDAAGRATVAVLRQRAGRRRDERCRRRVSDRPPAGRLTVSLMLPRPGRGARAAAGADAGPRRVSDRRERVGHGRRRRVARAGVARRDRVRHRAAGVAVADAVGLGDRQIG